RPWAIPLVTVLLFLMAVAGIHWSLQEIHLDEVRDELRSVSLVTLIEAALATVLSYLAMIGYDASALRYIGHPLPWQRVVLGSFASYAISNTIGFSLVSGSSVRYRIYAEAGLDAADVGCVTVFCSLSMAIGILVVGASAAAWNPEVLVSALHSQPFTIRLWALLGLSVVVIGILFTVVGRPQPLQWGRFPVTLPGWRMAIFQVLLAILDVIGASTCLYVFLPPGEISFVAFLPIYAIGLLVGVLSHIPGGLGVFEGTLLFALDSRVSTEALTGALLLYRFVYFLLPLLLATCLLVVRELAERAQPAFDVARQLGSWGTRLVPPVSAGLAFFSGMILLASSALPGIPERLDFIGDLLPLTAVEISYVLGGLVGLALMVLAHGLFRRVKGAFVITLGLCAAGALLALIRGGDYEEASVLLITMGILWLCRREFYRRSALLDAPFTGGWFMAILAAFGGTVGIALFAYKEVEYSHLLWWQFSFGDTASRSLRALLVVAMATVALALRRLLKHTPQRIAPPDDTMLAQAQHLITHQNRTLPNLALLGDKPLLFNETGDGFVMFGVQGSSWIGMGDPVGPESAMEELAWRFRELVDKEGGRIAFYQTRARYLPLYLDMGLSPLKLGEEALVPLDAFTLIGPQAKTHRYVLKRCERDGLWIEILPPGAFDHHCEELTRLSDAWLASKQTREKRFSLGAFVPDYLRHFEIARVGLGDQAVAFASLWTTADRAEVAVDLMRFTREAPNLTMHYLFLKLILHYQAQGYRCFSLGVAPLSGLEDHPLAPLWHRFGALLYNRGETLYNFQGLRQFKDKFNPQWEPVYLVTEGGLAP
ncbi:MAG: bifunctional lysylphosphatidylglycerol flippase/synthetase MprF, partial [Pseudomonadota bacterium]